MILMTLNCRGLDSLPKTLAVKRLIDEQSLDVIFLQETMSDGCILVKEMELLLKDWQFVFVADIGDFFWGGGLVIFLCLMSGI